jgi:hypothetical protein
MAGKQGAKPGVRHWIWVSGVVLLGAALYLVLVGL